MSKPRNTTRGIMEKMNIGPKTFLLALCGCVVWCGGCFTKKPATVHMTGIVLAHPLTPSGVANETAGRGAGP